ncbi:MAG: ABC transporter ATP-binding protein [Spirochaetota bacterium]|jgi:ABC-2 type transport system ATP-binding protein|nr:ABC transporter ATP-binding protein [Spirochaetota bacterium]
MLKVENLCKNFGQVRALDHVSFGLSRGEIVGFLGPNGAGKTTAMRIISGFYAPGEGTVEIDGINIEDDPIAAKARVGYLPEQPPLYPELRVREYLEFAAGLRGVPKKDVRARVDEAMAAVRVTDRADQIIRSLSKGYKQRVGLAGALVHRPPMLILDEPTVGLDPKQIMEIRNLISDLKASDRTLIISTHILAEVEQTCDRVIIIHRGRIAAVNTKAALLAGSADGDALDVNIEVARNPERAMDVLRGAGFSPASAGGNRCTIQARPESREEIARALVESGCGLLSLEMRRLALEDIFIKLTADDLAQAE